MKATKFDIDAAYGDRYVYANPNQPSTQCKEEHCASNLSIESQLFGSQLSGYECFHPLSQCLLEWSAGFWFRQLHRAINFAA